MDRTKGIGIVPMGKRCLVRNFVSDPLMESMIIHMPEGVSEKNKPQRGIIVSVGDKFDVLSLVPGDEVLFVKHGPEEFKHEGETFYLIKESDILSRVEGEARVT